MPTPGSLTFELADFYFDTKSCAYTKIDQSDAGDEKAASDDDGSWLFHLSYC